MQQASYSFSSISYDQIDFSQKWSLHPFLYSCEDTVFQASISKVGILSPPLVKQTSPDRFEIIHGFRRLTASALSGQSVPVLCRVVDKKASEQHIASLLLADCCQIKSLSSIETAYFLQLCNTLQIPEDTLALFGQQLGISLSKANLQRIASLLTLPPAIQLALHTGAIAENTAVDLAGLAADDQMLIFGIFSQVHFGGNKQKRFLGLIKELAQRSSCSITDYFSRTGLTEIISRNKNNPPQLGHLLLQKLQELTFPELNREQDRFNQWKSQLQLPTQCEIIPSRSFEKDTTTLAITFKNAHELEFFWNKIKDLLE